MSSDLIAGLQDSLHKYLPRDDKIVFRFFFLLRFLLVIIDSVHKGRLVGRN